MKKFSKLLIFVLILSLLPLSTKAYYYSDTTNHWGKEQINNVTNAIFSVKENNNFYPNKKETRIEFVTNLALLLGEGEYVINHMNTQVYSDVPAGSVNAGAVAWAKNKGITTGISDYQFGPNLMITREQLCTFIYRACTQFGLYIPNYSSFPSFSDESSISSWAKTAVTKMKKAHFINGYDDGTFRPKANITKAEVCSIENNLMNASMLRIKENNSSKQGNKFMINDFGWIIFNYEVNYKEYGMLTVGNKVRYYYRSADQATDLSRPYNGLEVGFLEPIHKVTFIDGNSVYSSTNLTKNNDKATSGAHTYEQHIEGHGTITVNKVNSLIAQLGYGLFTSNNVYPWSTTFSITLSY